MRRACLLAFIPALAFGAAGCEQSCHELADEWHRMVESYGTECSASSECTLIVPEYDMNSGCSIAGCHEVARMEAASDRRLVSLAREWVSRHCEGRMQCDCWGPFTMASICSGGQCALGVTWEDAGAAEDAQPDAGAPEDATADAPTD